MIDNDVVDAMPYLNRYALYLTKNDADAKDLVSVTIVKAIEIIRFEKANIQKPGSYLAAIMRTSFYSSFTRKKKVDQGSCEFNEEFMGIKEPDQEVVHCLKDIDRLISNKNDTDKHIINSYIEGRTAKSISSDMRGFRSGLSTVQNVIRNFKSDAAQII